jgi:hypothetical protein
LSAVIEVLIFKLKKMKKIVVLASALILATGVTVFGQTQKTSSTPATQATVKPSQPTKAVIAVNQLPKAAQDYLTKTYSGKKVDQAMKITDPNGSVMYLAEMGTVVAHFDMTGKFIKESKKDEKAANDVKPATTPVKTQSAPAPKKEATAPAKK